MTKKTIKIACVKWLDASSNSGISLKSEFDDVAYREYYITSVGAMIKNDKHGVVLAQDILVDKDENTVRKTVSIPRKYIKSNKIINLKID